MGVSISSFKNYHFKFWVPVIFILLGLVPFFITVKLIFLAKISGFLCLIFLLFALWYWKVVARNRNKKVSPVSINLNDDFFLEKTFLFYRFISPSQKKKFKTRLGLFLAEISSPTNNLNKNDWLRLAAIFVVLLWDKEYRSFSGFVINWKDSEEGHFIYEDKSIIVNDFLLRSLCEKMVEKDISLCGKKLNTLVDSNFISFLDT